MVPVFALMKSKGPERLLFPATYVLMILCHCIIWCFAKEELEIENPTDCFVGNYFMLI